MSHLPKLIVALFALAIIGYGYWTYQSAPGQADWLLKTIYLLLWLPMLYVGFASFLIWPSQQPLQNLKTQAQILFASLSFGGVVAVLPIMMFEQNILVNSFAAGLGSLVVIGSYSSLRGRAARFTSNNKEA